MRRGEEEQATDIKSNNPHLAGGEKPFVRNVSSRKRLSVTKLLCLKASLTKSFCVQKPLCVKASLCKSFCVKAFL